MFALELLTNNLLQHLKLLIYRQQWGQFALPVGKKDRKDPAFCLRKRS